MGSEGGKMTPVVQAGIWRHFRGGLYQVLGVGQHTETNELVVIYVALSGPDLPGPRIRVRPLDGHPDSFLSKHDGEPRFTFIGSEL
jgi:hypothetical protein